MNTGICAGLRFSKYFFFCLCLLIQRIQLNYPPTTWNAFLLRIAVTQGRNKIVPSATFKGWNFHRSLAPFPLPSPGRSLGYFCRTNKILVWKQVIVLEKNMVNKVIYLTDKRIYLYLTSNSSNKIVTVVTVLD